MSAPVAAEVYSVGQLYRKSKNALAREFRGHVWVAGEIKNLRRNNGNLYISLVEPGDFADGSDIALDIACWSKRRLVIENQLAKLGIELAAGMEVRIQGEVSLGKLGKLQLTLSALDTDALLGKQQAEKRLLREALIKEGVAYNNKKLDVALVPLRIGLVTSEGSDGFHDFVGELERAGFNFSISLVHSAVQGPAAAASLARAVSSFEYGSVDVIALVRGGGGELDAYDKEPVVRAIANCPIPIWTGIGHTADQSLSDEFANRSCITPTACAQAIGGVVAAYTARVLNAGMHLQRSVRVQMERSDSVLHRRADQLSRACKHQLAMANAVLDGARKSVVRQATLAPERARSELTMKASAALLATDRSIERPQQTLAVKRAQVMGLDPQMPLRRGYSLTYGASGELVRGVADISVGAELVTYLADGRLSSTVSAKTVSNDEGKQ